MNRVGPNNAVFRLNGQSVPVRVSSSAAETTVITQTFGAGTADEYEFSWTLTNVASAGTFRDGSPWVVPVEGQTIQLVSATPSNQTQTVSGITFYDGQTGSLTIRHSGIIINPTGGLTWDIADRASRIPPSGSGWRTGDNRVSNLPVRAATAQSLCDDEFDVAAFSSIESQMASGGVSLSIGDVCILTNSLFDETDLVYTGSFSVGCTGTSGNGTAWGVLSPVRWQAALYVLASALESPSTTFRPPAMWDSSLFGDRPIFTEEDVVDLSALVHSTSTNNLTSGSIGYGYTGASLTGDDFITGPIIFDQSGLHNISQMAAFNLAPGLKSTYGGDVAIVIGNILAKAFQGGIDTARLYSYLQFCLDVYGHLIARTMVSSGAGQKPGIGLPNLLFMAKSFGLTTRYGVEEMLADVFNAAYASSTGDSSYASLSATQKTAVKQSLYYEEYTCRAIEASGSGDFAYDTLGSSLRATIDPVSDIQSYDLSRSSVKIEKDGSNNYVLSADAVYALSSDATDQIGEYLFLPYQGGDVETINGFGHLELVNRPSGLWSGADLHADNYCNLLGCTLDIDATLYYIVAVSENVESGYTLTSASPIHIMLDRPLESDPTAASSISIYPFRSTDVGKYYYHREGSSRPAWSGPFMMNDGYGKHFHKSNAQYTALRILDGNATKLGAYGQMMTNHLWDASAPHQWMFGNDAGPRNMHAFSLGPAQAGGQWTLAITGQTATEVCRNLVALQQA